MTSKTYIYCVRKVVFGNSLFMVGEHKALGHWEEAIRMENVEPNLWVLPVDSSALGSKFKFLEGRYDKGKFVPVGELIWETGKDRTLHGDGAYHVEFESAYLLYTPVFISKALFGARASVPKVVKVAKDVKEFVEIMIYIYNETKSCVAV